MFPPSERVLEPLEALSGPRLATAWPEQFWLHPPVLTPITETRGNIMRTTSSDSNHSSNDRRSFLKKGLATGAAGAGLALLGDRASAIAQDMAAPAGSLTKGDAALLRFAAAAEILEADFWIQYNELGGIQDSEVPGGSGNPVYTKKLQVLDSDFPQYIHDNTDDEITHHKFLNAYLQSKGAAPVDLERFRTLEGSKADGSSGKPRLTNLMQLTLDTSWWTRYRSSDNNPDLDPNFVFPQAVPGLAQGQHTAIPRTNADLTPPRHIQAIANTAGFHMPTIEQGGNSLYPALAQRVSSVEVLRILISIGPTETMHFQTWSDKAGNALPLTDPTNGAGVSRPQRPSLRWRDLPNQPNHARALPIPESKAPQGFDHSAD